MGQNFEPTLSAKCVAAEQGRLFVRKVIISVADEMTEFVSHYYLALHILSNMQFQPITDKKAVKDVLVIGPPTLATDKMGIIYNNQVAGLNMIRSADEHEESDLHQVTIIVCYYYIYCSNVDIFRNP